MDLIYKRVHLDPLVNGTRFDLFSSRCNAIGTPGPLFGPRACGIDRYPGVLESRSIFVRTCSLIMFAYRCNSCSNTKSSQAVGPHARPAPHTLSLLLLHIIVHSLVGYTTTALTEAEAGSPHFPLGFNPATPSAPPHTFHLSPPRPVLVSTCCV